MAANDSFYSDSLSQLETIWADAYIREKLAIAHLNTIEKAILNRPEVAAKTKVEGLHHISKLDYTTGKSASWDQLALQEVKPMVPSVLWPFITTFKLSASNLDKYESKFPEAWSNIKGAVSRIPGKPKLSLANGAVVSEAIKKSQPALGQSVFDLEEAWADTKARFQLQRKIRVSAEKDILQQIDQLSPCATVRLGRVKITFNQTIKIDQDKLRSLKKLVPDNQWLFVTHYKENKISSKNVKNNIPEVWSILKEATQSKPKKVHFSFAA